MGANTNGKSDSEPKNYTIEASVSKLKVDSKGKISFHLTGAEGYCVKHKEEINEKKEYADVSYNIFMESFETDSEKPTTKNAICIPEKKEFKLEKVPCKILQVLSISTVNKSKVKFVLEFSETVSKDDKDKEIKTIESIEMM